MGKQSKNGTGSGGDERNMYYRRYKSTSNSSKASTNASLVKRENEFESSIRSKNTGPSVKQIPVSEKINIKNKLRSPVKTGLGEPTTRVIRPNIVSTNKEIKKPAAGASKAKVPVTNMKQETETVDQKQLQNMPAENKELTEQIENKSIKDSNLTEAEPTLAHNENGNSNGVHENDIPAEESHQNKKEENGNAEENGEKCLESNEKEEEFKLHLEAEESNPKSEEVCQETVQISQENAQNESKTSTEEVKEASTVDSETCSFDVVESTTSEVTESSELSSETKEKDNEKEASNYDSSVPLKDVQVKLNDCLKDSTQENETNADQSTSEYVHKESTFGKTLRTISGRSSIGRMRHVTLRDRQPSPNSSLFVNTSSASFSEDNSSGYKILRHRTPTSDLTPGNGSSTPLERKRKILEDNSSAKKKAKSEESSNSSGLLNASFELLKSPFSSLRRPVQVSTPLKDEKEKSSQISGGEIVKYEEPAKKWCVIM